MTEKDANRETINERGGKLNANIVRMFSCVCEKMRVFIFSRCPSGAHVSVHVVVVCFEPKFTRFNVVGPSCVTTLRFRGKCGEGKADL